MHYKVVGHRSVQIASQKYILMHAPEVIIDQGKLRGSICTSIRGENYYSFQGIPYATPPLGKLRFKAPVAPQKWSGTFDATKEGSPCYAKDLLKNEIVGSENCLVLNVYSKKLPNNESTDLCPVMFWIHGGAFIFGSGNTELYGPDFLLTENVVIVTINYRLGMLGFLSLEDSSLEIPGNAGLKDIIMALKWVQTNIEKFSGDPNNVTIFGQSAGGASVHLLLLSPMSEGLFHKAIAQSGCALNPWARGTSGVKEIAKAMGMEGSDEKTIYKSLMEKSVEEVYAIQEKITDNIFPSERRPFGFVVEKSPSESAFLAEEPINIMSSGKFKQIPFMTGYTTEEGMCYVFLKTTCEDVIPWFFGYQPGSPEIETVNNKIKQFYYGNEEPSQLNNETKFAMLSDSVFIYGIYVTVMSQFQMSKAPIYLYRASVETELNFFKKFLGIKEPGTCHMDDVGHIFKNNTTPNINIGSLEDISVQRFVRLWTNFAKYGNPTPVENDSLLNVVWKPVQEKEVHFLDIGEKLIATSNPDPERMNFWKELFKNSPAGQKIGCTNL